MPAGFRSRGDRKPRHQHFWLERHGWRGRSLIIRKSARRFVRRGYAAASADLNPYSVQSLVKRLLEAHDRGFWNPDEQVLETLRELLLSNAKK